MLSLDINLIVTMRAMFWHMGLGDLSVAYLYLRGVLLHEGKHRSVFKKSNQVVNPGVVPKTRLTQNKVPVLSTVPTRRQTLEAQKEEKKKEEGKKEEENKKWNWKVQDLAATTFMREFISACFSALESDGPESRSYWACPSLKSYFQTPYSTSL